MKKYLLIVSFACAFCIHGTLCSDICTLLNQCSGNGFCNTIKRKCECYDGFGSLEDLRSESLIRPIMHDCSEKVCPLGRAWVRRPNFITHPNDPVHGKDIECSGLGNCDRDTGTCQCLNGFRGSACQRKGCQASAGSELCSGKGECLSLRDMSMRDDAMPLLDPNDASVVYENDESANIWEADMIHGCICDSSWTVGTDAGEKQVSEYFGPTCSKKRCPSGDDPMTEQDETDCENKRQNYLTLETTIASGFGKSGNLCHVDCSNRGICDHSSGTCGCFTGYAGVACEKQDALAVGL